ncbi:uracil-DNA glycosylase [Oxyplasma meridianum]|uniref:Type-5 uracil-DNA glycosylase n=1 Tax=Oxyplasma meridianum TaxID=3073602 RepID=A0AAX4NFH5_9ARCH
MENSDKLMEKFKINLVKCRKCPRLVDFRETVLSGSKRYEGEEFWRKPVPGYGDIDGMILIVGLAPAASGGNRTGRVFTGDKSSDFLVSSLYEVGLANKSESVGIGDGLIYYNTYITAPVKCVPPDNIPLPEEVRNCQPYFHFEMKAMKNLKTVLVLGQFAFKAVLNYYSSEGYNTRGLKFRNGDYVTVGNVNIFCAYHPSPRNVNTGKLSRESFIETLKKMKESIGMP